MTKSLFSNFPVRQSSYKLKELGKVDEADIVDIAKEFCSLDYDQNGALKISNFHVSQATDPPA
jgi:hypothetical protein